jgi:hypothetical protein
MHKELSTSFMTGYDPITRGNIKGCSSFFNGFYCARLHTCLLKINDAKKLLNNV